MMKKNILKNLFSLPKRENIVSIPSGLLVKNTFSFSSKLQNPLSFLRKLNIADKKSFQFTYITKRTFAGKHLLKIDFPSHNKLKMPSLSPTMKTVSI
jgi:hypothetical protein